MKGEPVMAEARITSAAENPLCSRLKVKFDGRGLTKAQENAKTGTFRKVRTDSAAVKKAKSVANPFEETAQFVRAEAKTKNAAFADTMRVAKAAPAAAGAKKRVAAREVTTPFASGAYASAYARAAEIRERAYDGSEARAAAQRNAEREAKNKRPTPFTPSWFKGVLLGFEEDETEIKVKKSPISAGLVIGIAIFAIVVLMIIFSFAQISEFKKEISSLDAQKEELVERIDQLSLEIDLKNDIRVIEQRATEEFGMVKSNRVESKYISVAAGEKIELPAPSEESDGGMFSTMLSSMGSNWDKIMEYID